MSRKTSVKVLVFGLVQGVFFRIFTQQQAEALYLTGYVRNLSIGAVEAFAEGDKDKLKQFVSRLKTGPPDSKVDHIQITWGECSRKFNNFKIRY